MELNTPTDRDIDHLCFLASEAEENERIGRQVATDRFLANFLSRQDEAEQDEEIRRAGGYYDESDRIAFEMGHL